MTYPYRHEGDIRPAARDLADMPDDDPGQGMGAALWVIAFMAVAAIAAIAALVLTR